jgi:hypothetical protein
MREAAANVRRRRVLGGLAAGALAVAWPRADAMAAVAPLPDWVPAPGRRANVSLNTLADVDPCPSRRCAYSGVMGQRAVIAAWCGAAFAGAYGELGALLLTGGGHGDYYGNEVYAFDAGTRRWARLSEPSPGGPDAAVDYDEGEYAPGIPLSSHTYQHLQYLPPDWGGGPAGSLLLLVQYASGKLARGSGRTHAFDLADRRWARFSVNRSSPRVVNQSATTFDAGRRGFWRVPYGGGTIHFLDPQTRSWSSRRPGSAGGNNFGIELVCAHDPPHDRLVVVDWSRSAGARTWALDLAAPLRWQAVATTGETPPFTSRGMGLEWCPPLACFVACDGSGGHVYRLHPERENGAPWRWVREDLGGEPPAIHRGTQGVYNRFRWAPSLRSFLMVGSSTLPVQAWRLHGT